MSCHYQAGKLKFLQATSLQLNNPKIVGKRATKAQHKLSYLFNRFQFEDCLRVWAVKIITRF